MESIIHYTPFNKFSHITCYAPLPERTNPLHAFNPNITLFIKRGIFGKITFIIMKNHVFIVTYNVIICDSFCPAFFIHLLIAV